MQPVPLERLLPVGAIPISDISGVGYVTGASANSGWISGWDQKEVHFIYFHQPPDAPKISKGTCVNFHASFNIEHEKYNATSISPILPDLNTLPSVKTFCSGVIVIQKATKGVLIDTDDLSVVRFCTNDRIDFSRFKLGQFVKYQARLAVDSTSQYLADTIFQKELHLGLIVSKPTSTKPGVVCTFVEDHLVRAKLDHDLCEVPDEAKKGDRILFKMVTIELPYVVTSMSLYPSTHLQRFRVNASGLVVKIKGRGGIIMDTEDHMGISFKQVVVQPPGVVTGTEVIYTADWDVTTGSYSALSAVQINLDDSRASSHCSSIPEDARVNDEQWEQEAISRISERLQKRDVIPLERIRSHLQQSSEVVKLHLKGVEEIRSLLLSHPNIFTISRDDDVMLVTEGGSHQFSHSLQDQTEDHVGSYDSHPHLVTEFNHWEQEAVEYLTKVLLQNKSLSISKLFQTLDNSAPLIWQNLPYKQTLKEFLAYYSRIFLVSGSDVSLQEVGPLKVEINHSPAVPHDNSAVSNDNSETEEPDILHFKHWEEEAVEYIQCRLALHKSIALKDLQKFLQDAFPEVKEDFTGKRKLKKFFAKYDRIFQVIDGCVTLCELLLTENNLSPMDGLLSPLNEHVGRDKDLLEACEKSHEHDSVIKDRTGYALRSETSAGIHIFAWIHGSVLKLHYQEDISEGVVIFSAAYSSDGYYITKASPVASCTDDLPKYKQNGIGVVIQKGSTVGYILDIHDSTSIQFSPSVVVGNISSGMVVTYQGVLQPSDTSVYAATCVFIPEFAKQHLGVCIASPGEDEPGAILTVWCNNLKTVSFPPCEESADLLPFCTVQFNSKFDKDCNEDIVTSFVLHEVKPASSDKKDAEGIVMYSSRDITVLLDTKDYSTAGFPFGQKQFKIGTKVTFSASQEPFHAFRYKAFNVLPCKPCLILHQEVSYQFFPHSEATTERPIESEQQVRGNGQDWREDAVEFIDNLLRSNGYLTVQEIVSEIKQGPSSVMENLKEESQLKQLVMMYPTQFELLDDILVTLVVKSEQLQTETPYLEKSSMDYLTTVQQKPHQEKIDIAPNLDKKSGSNLDQTSGDNLETAEQKSGQTTDLTPNLEQTSVDYLVTCLEKHVAIPIKNISGYLSQSSLGVQKMLNDYEKRNNFLKKFNCFFRVSDGVISLQNLDCKFITDKVIPRSDLDTEERERLPQSVGPNKWAVGKTVNHLFGQNTGCVAKEASNKQPVRWKQAWEIESESFLKGKLEKYTAIKLMNLHSHLQDAPPLVKEHLKGHDAQRQFIVNNKQSFKIDSEDVITLRQRNCEKEESVISEHDLTVPSVNGEMNVLDDDLNQSAFVTEDYAEDELFQKPLIMSDYGHYSCGIGQVQLLFPTFGVLLDNVTGDRIHFDGTAVRDNWCSVDTLVDHFSVGDTVEFVAVPRPSGTQYTKTACNIWNISRNGSGSRHIVWTTCTKDSYRRQYMITEPQQNALKHLSLKFAKKKKIKKDNLFGHFTELTGDIRDKLFDRETAIAFAHLFPDIFFEQGDYFQMETLEFPTFQENTSVLLSKSVNKLDEQYQDKTSKIGSDANFDVPKHRTDNQKQAASANMPVDDRNHHSDQRSANVESHHWETQAKAFIASKLMKHKQIYLRNLHSHFAGAPIEVIKSLEGKDAQRDFLQKWSNVFCIGEDEIISLVDAKALSIHLHASGLNQVPISLMNVQTKQKSLPCRVKGTGTISKMYPTYGLISCQKTDEVIHFKTALFSGMGIGDIVDYEAVPRDAASNYKFGAIKIIVIESFGNGSVDIQSNSSCSGSVTSESKQTVGKRVSSENEHAVGLGTVTKLFNQYGHISCLESDVTIHFKPLSFPGLCIGDIVEFEAWPLDTSSNYKLGATNLLKVGLDEIEAVKFAFQKLCELKTITLQNLSGHFSQASQKVRDCVMPMDNMIKFFKKHNILFKLHAYFVSLQVYSKKKKESPPSSISQQSKNEIRMSSYSVKVKGTGEVVYLKKWEYVAIVHIDERFRTHGKIDKDRLYGHFSQAPDTVKRLASREAAIEFVTKFPEIFVLKGADISMMEVEYFPKPATSLNTQVKKKEAVIKQETLKTWELEAIDYLTTRLQKDKTVSASRLQSYFSLLPTNVREELHGIEGLEILIGKHTDKFVIGEYGIVSLKKTKTDRDCASDGGINTGKSMHCSKVERNNVEEDGPVVSNWETDVVGMIIAKLILHKHIRLRDLPSYFEGASGIMREIVRKTSEEHHREFFVRHSDVFTIKDDVIALVDLTKDSTEGTKPVTQMEVSDVIIEEENTGTSNAEQQSELAQEDDTNTLSDSKHELSSTTMSDDIQEQAVAFIVTTLIQHQQIPLCSLDVYLSDAPKEIQHVLGSDIQRRDFFQRNSESFRIDANDEVRLYEKARQEESLPLDNNPPLVKDCMRDASFIKLTGISVGQISSLHPSNGIVTDVFSNENAVVLRNILWDSSRKCDSLLDEFSQDSYVQYEWVLRPNAQKHKRGVVTLIPISSEDLDVLNFIMACLNESTTSTVTDLHASFSNASLFVRKKIPSMTILEQFIERFPVLFAFEHGDVILKVDIPVGPYTWKLSASQSSPISQDSELTTDMTKPDLQIDNPISMEDKKPTEETLLKESNDKISIKVEQELPTLPEAHVKPESECTNSRGDDLEAREVTNRRENDLEATEVTKMREDDLEATEVTNRRGDDLEAREVKNCRDDFEAAEATYSRGDDFEGTEVTNSRGDDLDAREVTNSRDDLESTEVTNSRGDDLDAREVTNSRGDYLESTEVRNSIADFEATETTHSIGDGFERTEVTNSIDYLKPTEITNSRGDDVKATVVSESEHVAVYVPHLTLDSLMNSYRNDEPGDSVADEVMPCLDEDDEVVTDREHGPAGNAGTSVFIPQKSNQAVDYTDLQTSSAPNDSDILTQVDTLYSAKCSENNELIEGSGRVCAVLQPNIVVQFTNLDVGVFTLATDAVPNFFPKLGSDVRYVAKRSTDNTTKWIITDLFAENHFISAAGSSLQCTKVKSEAVQTLLTGHVVGTSFFEIE